MGLKLNEKNILAIDDEMEILLFIKEFLEDHFYKVYVATSGAEGLKIVKDNKIHLILLDIAMPGMGGLEVLPQLKKNPETASIPVLMLTARMDTSTILEAQQMGARDYVVKPFQPEDLLKWIKVYEKQEPKKS